MKWGSDSFDGVLKYRIAGVKEGLARSEDLEVRVE